MIRHHIFGAAHIDRIGTASGPVSLKRSNPGSMTEAAGGAALNVASSLTAFGAPVSLSSVVGLDDAGSRVRAVAQERGIDFRGLTTTASLPTATYTALLDRAGELIIALADMDIYASVDGDGVEFPDNAWILIDANFPSTAIENVLRKPAAHRAAMTTSAAKAQRLRPHVQHLDLLFTNRAEAAALCEVAETTAPPMLAARLHDLGCKRAIISDGAAPLALIDDGVCTEFPVDAVAVKDVTGAGDALTAGTLFALGEGRALPDAVRTGIAAARAILIESGPFRADLADVIGHHS